MSAHPVRRASRIVQALLGGCLLVAGAAQAATVDLGFTQCKANPNPGVRGGNVTFTLNYSATATATDAVIRFPVPQGSNFVSASLPGCKVAGSAIECHFSSLSAGRGSVDLTLDTKSAANALITTAQFEVGPTDVDPTPANNTQECSVSINDGADLSLQLSGQTEVPAGSDITWNATITNHGPNGADKPVFTTTLPPTLTYKSTSSPGWSCAPSGADLGCTYNSVLANGATAPQLSFVTELRGDVTSGDVEISGSVRSPTTADWDTSNNTSDHSVKVIAGADLQITQAPPSPTLPLPNDLVTFVLTAKNNGPSDAADGVTVTFELPADFTPGAVPTPSGAGWGACSWAGRLLTCPHTGNYISGRSETITVTATTPNVTEPTTYGNIPAIITGGATGPVDPNPDNNRSPSSVQVSPDKYANLSFKKTKSPNPVALGDTMTSVIPVSNSGPYPAEIGTITVTDILTDGAESYMDFSKKADWDCTLHSDTPAGKTSVICTNRKALPVDQTLTLTIQTKAEKAAVLRNDAKLEYSGPGPGISYISAEVTATEKADSPDLSIKKTVTTGSTPELDPVTLLNTQDTLTYQLLITNDLGTGVAAKDLEIKDKIPGFITGTKIIPVVVIGNTSGTSTASFNCGVAGADVTCTQDKGTLLNAGDTVTVTIEVSRPLASGSHTNTASVFSTSQGDPDRTNNTDSVKLSVQPIADLEMVSKTFSPNPAPAGADIEYILTFLNHGPDEARDVVVKDTFIVPANDPGFTFLSATSSAGGSCKGLTADQSYGDVDSPHTVVCEGLILLKGQQGIVTVKVRPNWAAGGGATTLKNQAWLYSTKAAEGTDPADGPGDLAYGTTRGDKGNFKELEVPVAPANLDALIVNSDDPDFDAGPDPLPYSGNNGGNDPANDIVYRVRMVNQGPSLATGLHFTYVMTPPDSKTVRFLGDDAVSSGAFTAGICDQVGQEVTGPASMSITCRYPIGGPDHLPATPGTDRLHFLKFRALSDPGNSGNYVVQTRAEIFTNETDANSANNVSTESTTIAASGFGIFGRVFLDINDNGIPESGDSGFGGQRINLYDSSGLLITHTMTDAFGNYSFLGLSAGTYSVEQPNQPANSVNGLTTPGTVGGVSTGRATDRNTTPSKIEGIVLSTGGPNTQISLNNWFAEVTKPGLSGTVWLDSNHDRILDPGEPLLSNWRVVLKNAVAEIETRTDANGAYSFSDLMPGSDYEVLFYHPDSNTLFGRPVPNEKGTAYTSGTSGPGNLGGADNSNGTLRNISIQGGKNLPEQSLPLDPGGVVYDAISRQPVSGAVVTLSGPGLTGADVLGGSLTQTTGSEGYYQFLLLGTAQPGNYSLTVTAPAGYVQAPSTLIPACNASLTVAASGNPALVQSGNQAPQEAVQPHDVAACSPSSSVGAATTQYYFEFNYLGGGLATDSVINNHIPLDPILGGAIVMTKTTPKVNVTRGELVPYVLTARNTLSSLLNNIVIEDQLPPGFKYVKGSAQIDGVPVEPELEGRRLRFPERTLNGGQTVVIKMLLVVGSGVGFNEYVNQTWALNTSANSRVSNVASATVRVVADPTFDCSDLIGTVYDDQNRNGYQDQGEPGIAGARVATPKGWLVTTDQHGRFHIACADVPSEMRGSNFILKADERSLPSGYRITTENPRVVRMTQGRLVKANFGASIHRVVRLDLNSEAFGADHQLIAAYQERLDEVLTLLYAEPSILRIAYHMPVEGEVSDARKRVGNVRSWFKKQWEPNDCCYDLQLEEEIVPVADNMEVIQ